MSSCSECCLGGSEPHRASLSSESFSTAIFSRSAAKSEFKNFQKFSEIACKRFSRLTFKFDRFWSSKFYKQWPGNLFSVIIGIFNLKLDQKFSILIWAGAGSVFENPNKILNTNPKNSNSGFRVFYIARSWDQNPHDFGLVGSWDFHFRGSGF